MPTLLPQRVRITLTSVLLFPSPAPLLAQQEPLSHGTAQAISSEYGWLGFAIALILALVAVAGQTRSRRQQAQIEQQNQQLQQQEQQIEQLHSQYHCLEEQHQQAQRHHQTQLQQRDQQQRELEQAQAKLQAQYDTATERGETLQQDNLEQRQLIQGLNDDLTRLDLRRDELETRLSEQAIALNNSEQLLADARQQLKDQAQGLSAAELALHQQQQQAAQQHDRLQAAHQQAIDTIEQEAAEQIRELQRRLAQATEHAPSPATTPNPSSPEPEKPSESSAQPSTEPSELRIPGLQIEQALKRYPDQQSLETALNAFAERYQQAPQEPLDPDVIEQLRHDAQAIGANMLHEAAKALAARLKQQNAQDLPADTAPLNAALRHVLRSIDDHQKRDQQAPHPASTTPLPEPKLSDFRDTDPLASAPALTPLDPSDISHRYDDLKLLLEDQDPVANECLNQLLQRASNEQRPELERIQNALRSNDYATGLRVLNAIQ